MRKILIIPHHPGLSKIKIRLIEIAKELSKDYIVYVVNWRAAFEGYSLGRRISSSLLDMCAKKRCYEQQSLRIVEFPIMHRPLAIAPAFNYFWLKKIIEKEKIDVVINGSYYMFSIPQVRNFTHLYDIADLPVLTDDTRFDAFIRQQLSEEIPKAEVITVVSEGLVEYIADHYQREATCIPNGADLKKMRSVRQEEVEAIRRRYGLSGKWVIGYIGHLGPWVNIELVISAFNELERRMPDIALLCIGMSSHLEELKKRYAKDTIIFTGGIDADIEPYFKAIDLGIIPHRASMFQDMAFHLKFIEYTAAQKCIVSTPMKEIQRLNFPNVVCIPEDTMEWAKAFQKAREIKWKAEWDTLVEEYAWEEIGKKFSALIEEKKFLNSECTICGSREYKLVQVCEVAKIDADIPQKVLQLVRCRGCGLVCINPQGSFTPQQAESLYTKEYFDAGYMRFYAEKGAATQSNEPFAFRLSLIEKFKTCKGRLLDIGCASGGFLAAAREKGWEPFGVDISSYAVERGLKEHGLQIFNGTLEQARFADNHFDVITAGDLLEHLPDPKGFLLEIRRILKDDGIAYIAVPNFGSFHYIVMSMLARVTHKNYFALPYHIYNFTRSTLLRLLRESGFEPLEIHLTESRLTEKGITRFIMEGIFFIGRLLAMQDRMVVIVKKGAKGERVS